jgi:dTDP-4-amino-4,6-dideoxygalactose transaminase
MPEGRAMIEFNDLRPLHTQLDDELTAAAVRVLRSGRFVLGAEVEAFETAFAEYHDVPHAVGVASGTDALELALRAGGVGPGDEVITVAHTAVATVCAVERAGATPVLVDVDPATGTMDPDAAAAAVTPRTRALLPVHLYGQPADMDALIRLADRQQLLLIEDCAQAHGARFGDRRVGTFGHLAAFSFYPTKNLGACGDGGAVLTRDPLLADRVRRLRVYGQIAQYHHLERGINSRLDELQAALLAVKLRHLDAQNRCRRSLAAVYERCLREVETPYEAPRSYHVYHLYVVRHPRRDWLREQLQRRGIGTQVHYPVPIHRQPAFQDLGYRPGSLPVSERLARTVLSLPLHLGLDAAAIATVAHAVAECAVEVELVA